MPKFHHWAVKDIVSTVLRPTTITIATIATIVAVASTIVSAAADEGITADTI
jgi:hypothetical protein